jgi:hypothetical protein
MDVFRSDHVDGVLDAGSDVFVFEVRIEILSDLGKAQAFTDELQHALHGDSRASHTRLPEMNLWADGDSILHGQPLSNNGHTQAGLGPDRMRVRRRRGLVGTGDLLAQPSGLE